MGDIVKNIRIAMDDKEIQNINSKLDKTWSIIQKAQASGASKKTLDALEKQEASLRRQLLYKERMANTQKKVDKYFKDELKMLKQQEREEKKKAFQEKHPFLSKKGDQLMAATANKIKGFFKGIWSGVLSDIKGMLDMKTGAATYNMGTSLITNSQAREMSMKYGLGAGQTYALKNTMDMLGMSSDEDLMYMNTAQKEKFNELMNKYSSWYDEMEQSGFLQNVQEAQLELKMFKQEVAMKFMNWFAENKDVIMGVINGTLKVLEVLATALFAILKFLHIGTSGSTSSALSSEELNNATTNNNALSINNTVNANVTTSNQADAQNFGRDVADGSIRLYNQMINTL